MHTNISEATMLKFLTLSILISCQSFAMQKNHNSCGKLVCKEIPDIEDSIISIKKDTKTFNKNQIKLAVWNIYKNKKDGFEQKYETLQNTNDFLMIQEALHDGENETMHIRANHNFDMAVSFIRKNNQKTGVATLAPIVPTAVKIIRTMDKEPIVKTPKAALLTKYLIDNREILLINIHSLNATNTSKFLRQLEEIGKFLNDYKEPIIFAGDFNTRNKDRMEKLLAFMALHYLEKVPIFTEKNLDHIFAKDINVIKFTHEVSEYSDHPILFLTFNFEID